MKTKSTVRALALLILTTILLCLIPAGGVAAKAPDTFKVLFIGNSYSDDATDGYSGGMYYSNSNLLAMLESKVGRGNAAVGLAWSGGKTMAWHASMAKTNASSHTFVYTDNRSKGWEVINGSSTVADAIKYTDWDVVVLQPYGQEMTDGYSSPMDGMLSEFSKLDKSLPYMIDFVANNAPDAKVYLHLQWSPTTETTLNAGADVYKKIAATMRTIETYTGTETGKAIDGVLPLGAAVQAIRGTFIATLDFNSKAASADKTTDPQIGIQRDAVHLSLGIGRFLVNYVTMETLLPDLPINEADFPMMRNSQKAGRMPQIYYDLVYQAADLALASAEGKGNSKYLPKKLEGYETSGIEEIAEEFKDTSELYFGVLEGSTKEQAEAEIENMLDMMLSDIGASFDVTIKGDYTAPTFSSDTTVKLDANIQLGYESTSASFDAPLKAGYTVEVSADKNTTVVPGTIVVAANDSFAAVAFPKAGYEITSVTVDGTPVDFLPEMALIAIDSVTANTKIEVKTAKASPFVDVARDAWYFEGVMYVSEKGYMNGTNADKTTFSPDMKFTREQFVQLLFNIEGELAADYAGDTGFSDVPADQWYSAAVKWANEAGVTSGIGGGKFGLGGEVTREQLAKFLMNYAEMKGKDISKRADLSEFTDSAQVSSWATDAASWAVAEGFLGSTSTSAKVLSPTRVAVRSEIAKVTMNYAQYLEK
ncbi:MAG: DUF4886 domain-containing protein [Clostridia bacterium]|nr:DUF4886 domain-containing protein [Clostridia bacterium]